MIERVSVGVVACMVLSGCPLTEKRFAEAFVPAYCEVWDACNTSSRFCPVKLDDFESGDCDYDRSAARECLEATFTCADETEGFEFVETPEACLAHRICTNLIPN